MPAFASVIEEVDAATDEQELRGGVEHARNAVVTALTAHTPALQLAEQWSQVMASALAAASRLVAGQQEVGWTWFVSGSVARGEALPGSDIETLIALEDVASAERKTTALGLAADAHAVLERCGISGDANGVLASRARFCRRRASWMEGIERWCSEPARDRGVVMTGLLADSTAPWGGDLRLPTLAAVGRHPESLRAMLQDATVARAAIPSRLRVFATHVDAVDLKVAAVEPVVKIARWAALSAGCDAVSTLERLDAAARGGIVDAEDAAILGSCYRSLAQIRWRGRASAWINGEGVTELISMAALSPQERATVRDIGREVGGIRRKLAFLSSTPKFG